MDDSLMDSVFDDGGDSDNFSPVVAVVSCTPSHQLNVPAPNDSTDPLLIQKTKAKAAPKATAAKKALTAARAAPKKMTQTILKPKPKATVSKKRPKPDTEDEDEDSAPEADSLHDDTLLSNTPPSAKKQKKAPAPRKKTTGKPLQTLENEAPTFDGANEPQPKKGSATEQYQKVSLCCP